jgi:hypothetical protein
VLELAGAIDNMATYHERDGKTGHWVPASIIIELRKALAAMKETP